MLLYIYTESSMWFFQKRVAKNISLLSLSKNKFSEIRICEMMPLIPHMPVGSVSELVYLNKVEISKNKADNVSGLSSVGTGN